MKASPLGPKSADIRLLASDLVNSVAGGTAGELQHEIHGQRGHAGFG